jgi:uncharacterized membrane protein YgcG
MRQRFRLGAGLALVALAALVSVGTPTAAHAEDPVAFGSSHIADKAGALGNRESDVKAAIDRLYQTTRTDLYIVYVDSFTGAADRQAWATATANKNGMGTNDVLLAVATEDREFQLSVDPNFPLTDAQLQDVETNAIEPALRENDWAGAGIGAADGLAASIKGENVVAPNIVPGQPAPSGGGGGWGFLWIIVIAVIVIGAIIFFVSRRATSTRSVRGSTGQAGGATGGGGGTGRAGDSGATSGPPPVPTAQLKQQAASALVQTDDAIKTSEQELGFAVAQYGASSTEEFQTALHTAKNQLTQAFTLQQKLDDVEPDTEEQKRAWYAQIIDLCTRANAALDEQAEAFDELRALEKNAPAAAASVAGEFDALEQRIAQAESRLASLAAGYTDAALATVADNPAQARERLAFARNALSDADTQLAAGKTSAAAVGIRAAEESGDQAKLLLDAVDRLGTDLQKAAEEVTTAITDLETDLITARALPGGDPAGTTAPSEASSVASSVASSDLPGVIATTSQIVDDAKSSLAAGKVNPLDLLKKLEAANTRMDSVLAGVRDAQAQAQRTRAALSQTMLSAQSQVSAASDFITTRRGAVGAEARTRLAEASRLVVQADAQSTTDPNGALATAQRANSLAADAVRLAQDDVNGFGGAYGGNGYADAGGGLGGMFGGGSRGGGGRGGGMMGAILGGIVINSVLGGGGGGIFGGGGGIFGGGGGRRGGGGSFGGFGSAGSFGGSGTRSRRGGGGRF